MARKVEVHLIDDLDGTRAEETVEFSLDGVNYQIDLSKKNAGKLRGGLDPYVQVARRLGRTPRRRQSGQGRATSGTGDREQNQAIREWALRKGIEVSPRGRIRRSLIEQYEAERRR
jgi:nucleoid-associated protein Lsr2